MARIQGLAAHERPPESMRLLFKRYQKSKEIDLTCDLNLLDLGKLAECAPVGFRRATYLEMHNRERCFLDFLAGADVAPGSTDDTSTSSVFEVEALPG